MGKSNVRVVAVSDLHGTLPQIPECDLLLIGGDVCGAHRVVDQAVWLRDTFKLWLESVPAEKIVGVAGNHDFIWERAKHLVPDLPWTYLEDSACEYRGWKIYGSPHQPTFFNWAFNLDEPDLERKWSLIPDDTDILLLHGPPYGIGDQAPRMNAQGYENTGSPSLTKRILEIKPQLVVFGHIHEGAGLYTEDDVMMANVSILDGKYRLINKPAEFFLTPEKVLGKLEKLPETLQGGGGSPEQKF